MMRSRPSIVTARRVMGIFCVLTLGACGSSSKTDSTTTPDRKQAATLLNHALQAQVAGETGAARSGYEEVIRLDPGNKFAYYYLGLIDETTGNRVAAESHFRLALTIDNTFTPALYNLGLLLRAVGKTAEGNAKVQAAVRLEPSLAEKAQAQGVPIAGK